MSTYNLGLAFYRKYYKDWNFSSDPAKPDLPRVKYPKQHTDKKQMEQSYFELKTQPLKEQQLPEKNIYRYTGKSINQSIKLKTTYPGLLIGSGYAHGIGMQGEYKIGFYFDYTTGLPIIPGSTVKGLIRSVFPMRYIENAKQLEKQSKPNAAKAYKALAENRREYIEYLILDQLKFKESIDDPKWIDQLEEEIFEGIIDYKKGGSPIYMPSAYRDIFHDAILTGPKQATFLGDDFITPHKNRNKEKDRLPDELKNPIPIQFLKVLPGKEFTFQFKLTDQYRIINEHTRALETHDRKLSAEQRKLFFHAIIEDLGIGAKTNVGYGQFEKPIRSIKSNTKRTTASDSTKPTHKTKPELSPKQLNKIKRGTRVAGIVTDNSGGKLTFQLDVIGYEAPVSVLYAASNLFNVGAKYVLEIKHIEGKGAKRKLYINFPSPKNIIE